MISIKCILLFIDEAGLARDNDNPVNIHIFLFFSPWTNAPSTKVPLANLNIYSCLILCTICVVMITNSASTGLLLNKQFIFVYKISQFSSARGMAALVGSLFASILRLLCSKHSETLGHLRANEMWYCHIDLD